MSETPLAKKLGLKPDGRLLLRGAPRGWAVPDLPDGVSVAPAAELGGGAASAPGDVVVAFVRARAELPGVLDELGRAVFPDGALWIAWPRRAAGHESDIRDQDVRDEALPLGLVDVKVAALGEDWSGLRLLWRLERRKSPAPG